MLSEKTFIKNITYIRELITNCNYRYTRTESTIVGTKRAYTRISRERE